MAILRVDAGRRTLDAPAAGRADGRTPSRRFVPTHKQAMYSSLLAAHAYMGASEAEVIGHLHRENEELRRTLMRLAGPYPQPIAVVVNRTDAPEGKIR